MAEASVQFGLQILAYCLMGNHYHLLVRTPRGNLSRCMRHINGIYTQRYNKLLKTDGALFRGRYKAILVDADNYLLEVSRYIHRNPIACTKPKVKKLQDYKLSSYPAYINQIKAPQWLNRDFVLLMMAPKNTSQKYGAYKAFVENIQNEEFAQFYEKTKLSPVMGNKDFIEKIKRKRINNSNEISEYKLLELTNMEVVVKVVAKYFTVLPEKILMGERGAGKTNLPRRIAMYLCKRHTNSTLTEIAEHFNVTHYSTISQTIRRLLNDKNSKFKVDKIINVLSQDLTPYLS